MSRYRGDVEELELQHISGGTENWHNYLEKLIGIIYQSQTDGDSMPQQFYSYCLIGINTHIYQMKGLRMSTETLFIIVLLLSKKPYCLPRVKRINSGIFIQQ